MVECWNAAVGPVDRFVRESTIDKVSSASNLASQIKHQNQTRSSSPDMVALVIKSIAMSVPLAVETLSEAPQSQPLRHRCGNVSGISQIRSRGVDRREEWALSRLENALSRSEVACMTATLVDIFCRSFSIPPASITLDMEDTCVQVHGHQQLSPFSAHHDTRVTVRAIIAGYIALVRFQEVPERRTLKRVHGLLSMPVRPAQGVRRPHQGAGALRGRPRPDRRRARRAGGQGRGRLQLHHHRQPACLPELP